MVSLMKDSSSVVWRIDRAGGGPPDAVTYAQRVASVGSTVRSIGRAHLLVLRDREQAIRSFLVTPRSSKSAMLAGSLASAVGGRHVHEEAGLPELDVSQGVMLLRAAPDDFGAREPMTGFEPTEMPLLVARVLQPGGWVLVSLRRPGKGEVKTARRWFHHRTSGATSHYSLSGDVMVGSLTVGGMDPSVAETVLTSLAATMPGFDVETSVVSPPGRLAGTGLSLLAGGAGAAAGHMVADSVPVAVAAAGVGGVSAVLHGTGRLPSRADKVAGSIASGEFSVPGRRSRTQVHAPRSAGTDRRGREVSAAPGTYPFRDEAFLLVPAQVAAIVCPHHGTGSASSGSRVLDLPPALSKAVGPVVGWVGDQPVRLSSEDGFSGVMAFGRPGSGKTALVLCLFAFDSLERVRPTERPGTFGESNTLIAFEDKGADGVLGYEAWLNQHGDASIRVDVADPSTARIDLLGPGTPLQQATSLTNRMRYAMGSESIGPRSYNTLVQVFTVALLSTSQDGVAAGLPEHNSFMERADTLLCSRGDVAGVALFDAITQRVARSGADDPGTAQVQEALIRLDSLYGPKATPASRRALVEAPQSKVALLCSVPSWWSDERMSVSFETILENHWAAVINTGPPVSGGVLADDSVTGVLSSMLMHALKGAIQSTCMGWRSTGRAVTVFSDELKLLSGHSPEVVEWMREQGRAFGVRLVFATQWPTQLHPGVRTATQGFGTVAWFGQDEPSVTQSAVADLAQDGSGITSGDIAGLEPFHSYLRATVGMRRQPAVPVAMAFWGAEDRHRFAPDQGWS